MDYYTFFFLKKFNFLKGITNVIFLLNAVISNFILLIFILLIHNYFLFIFLSYIIFFFVKLIIKKFYSNLFIKFFYYDKLTFSLVDGLIQIHPILFYLFVIIFVLIMFCNFINIKKNYKFTIYKILFLASYASVLTGGY